MLIPNRPDITISIKQVSTLSPTWVAMLVLIPRAIASSIDITNTKDLGT